jgi:TM2 domain-containing membrane protein YozV
MPSPGKKPKKAGKDTKYCVECGTKINAKAEICPKCGVRQPMPPEKKDPTIAALLSFVWCGAGHVYLGQLDKGVMLAVAFFILLIVGVMTLICLPLPIAIWVYGIYDAHRLAQASGE